MYPIIGSQCEQQGHRITDKPFLNLLSCFTIISFTKSKAIVFSTRSLINCIDSKSSSITNWCFCCSIPIWTVRKNNFAWPDGIGIRANRENPICITGQVILGFVSSFVTCQPSILKIISIFYIRIFSILISILLLPLGPSFLWWNSALAFVTFPLLVSLRLSYLRPVANFSFYRLH